jgi:signal transduction histidine kinase
MSFRARILAAFFVLGLLPLGVTGAIGYVLSARLVEALAAARAEASVQRHGRMLDGAQDLQRTVTEAAGALTPPGPVATPDSPPMRTFLVDTRQRRVFPVDGDPAVSEIEKSLALAAAVGGVGAAPVEGVVTAGDGHWVVAHAELSDDRWDVVGVGSLSELAGLWNRFRIAYVAFVALVLLGTGAALRVLVRPVMRTLEDLTEAAGLIGDGELAPWLPARSEGEVGRLSLATGVMVDRVQRMIRGVEQGARMAMVGQLATHLAHEIRNPLSSIRLNLQSLDRELQQGSIPSDVAEVTELCLDEIERLDQVATSVLRVGRAPQHRPRPAHLHEILRHAVSVMRPEFSRRSIILDLDLLAGRDDVLADRESMEGVFLNLFMNAVEALDTGGKIHVSSGTRRNDETKGWVWVEVKDDGPGIPEQVRDRIFEPFFTTKVDGTGVGLATALETVRAHGGSLSPAVFSDPNAGASFVVELPLLGPWDLAVPPPRMAHAQ